MGRVSHTANILLHPKLAEYAEEMVKRFPKESEYSQLLLFMQRLFIHSLFLGCSQHGLMWLRKCYTTVSKEVEVIILVDSMTELPYQVDWAWSTSATVDQKPTILRCWWQEHTLDTSTLLVSNLSNFLTKSGGNETPRTPQNFGAKSLKGCKQILSNERLCSHTHPLQDCGEHTTALQQQTSPSQPCRCTVTPICPSPTSPASCLLMSTGGSGEAATAGTVLARLVISFLPQSYNQRATLFIQIPNPPDNNPSWQCLPPDTAILWLWTWRMHG